MLLMKKQLIRSFFSLCLSATVLPVVFSELSLWVSDPNGIDPNIIDPNIIDPNVIDPNTVDPNIIDPNVIDPNTVDPNLVKWIEQWGIRWIFDKNLSAGDSNNTYRCGTYANGDYWVIGPVNIIGITPASVNAGGRIINGSMINPIPGGPQGYDSEAANWVPSLNIGMGVSPDSPLHIDVSDHPVKSLVSTISTAVVPDKVSEPRVQSASVLTIVAAAPSADAFRPPYCGSDKFAEIRKAHIDWNCLGELPPVIGTPPLSESEAAFERVWLDHGANYPGEVMHPVDNMPWYGREMSRAVSIAALQLNLDYPQAVKETLLVRFLQYGIDVSGVIACPEAQSIWTGNGGITNGRKLAGAFAARVFNHPAMIAQHAKSGKYLYEVSGYGPGNPPPDYIHFGNEDDQVFYVSQTDVDATNSPEWHPSDSEAYPYTAADIGLPEWGIRHAADPWYSNYWWLTAYRDVSGCTMPGTALAAHIMGIKAIWNNPAFFDYCDRYMAMISNETEYADKGWQWGTNGIDLYKSSRFVWNMWQAYRDRYGPVWSGAGPTLQSGICGWGLQKLPGMPLTGFVQVSAGGEHMLALRADGSITGWGRNDYGQASPPAGRNYTAIAAGGEHSLALKADGSIVGWGRNNYGQASPPAGTDYTAIAAGGTHSLAIRKQGFLAGWGNNGSGQVSVPPGKEYAAIAAGGGHSLALKTDGTLIGWGDNSFGQVTVPGGNDFAAVAAGGGHSLALRQNGSIAGWGQNDEGQAASPAGMGYTAIAAGRNHSAGLTAGGSVVGWGDNGFSQSAPPMGNFVAVAASRSHGLALRSDGSLTGWGNNDYGQASVPDGNDFVEIAAEGEHSLVIRRDGTLTGWGRNDYGQASVPDGNDFVEIAAGEEHSLAIRTDGTLAGWGNDTFGQASVPDGNDFVEIAAGGYHSLAIRTDGTLAGWGRNDYGQASVPDGNGFIKTAAGDCHSLAIRRFCTHSPAGDWNKDCRVDMEDLAMLSAHWLPDGQTGLSDLEVLAENWLVNCDPNLP
jgi:alpha-tubulin suppressor-like RCC1 family protein